MTNAKTAKIFKHGRSQAVRLPKEFRMPGTEVRVRRIGQTALGIMRKHVEPSPLDFAVTAQPLEQMRLVPHSLSCYRGARARGAAPLISHRIRSHHCDTAM